MAIGMFEDDVQHFESRTAGDKNVYVKFYIRPVKDDAASDKEGRPIYKDREYIEIRTPGQQNNIVQRPVSEIDRQRFQAAYRAFKSGEEEQTIGTPLTEMAWITRSQVEELTHIRVRTLEHLATLDDAVCSRYAGVYKLKQRAQQVLAESEKTAPLAALQAENDTLKEELNTLKVAVKEQSEVIKALQGKSKA